MPVIRARRLGLSTVSRVVAGALSLLALAGCRSAGVAECTEAGECPAPQVCNRHTRLCYTPEPVFGIEIARPAANAAVTGSAFQLSGTVLNAKEGVSSVQYQVADGGWAPAAVAESGHFEALAPLPTADGLPLTLAVQATDGTGAQIVAKVPIVADNISPVATLSAVDQERDHPLNIAVQFSEPVLLNDADGGAPLVLTPEAGPGEWNASRTEYRIANLSPDTHYSAEVLPNAVRDAANNLSLEVHADFRTAPAQPVDGVVLPAPAGQRFDLLDASADRDGVVTLAAHAVGGPDQVIWGWFDPRTGGFVSHVVATAHVAGLEVGASVEAELDAPRFHTLTVRDLLADGGTGAQAFWTSDVDTDGGVHQQLAGALAIVPGPPGCGEPGEPSAVGLVVDGGTVRYQRGGLEVPLSITPQRVAYTSASNWALVSATGTSVTVQSLDYACDGGMPPSVASGAPLTTDGAVTQFSVAGLEDNTLVAYDTASAGQSRVACASCSGGPGCSGNGFTSLKLASKHRGDELFGVWSDAQARHLAFVSADAAQACPPEWSAGAAVPSSANVTQFAPVMFGATPGVLYIDDQEGGLSVFRPTSP